MGKLYDMSNSKSVLFDCTPEEAAEIKKAVRNWDRRVSRALARARTAKGQNKIKAVSKYMLLVSSATRGAELVSLIKNEPSESFWPIFRAQWPSCDGAWQQQRRLAEIMQRVGPYRVGAFYEGLPDEITVYRGADRSRISGAISWTTDRYIAYGFAYGHRGIKPPDPVIATGSVNKTDVYFATDDRGEREVICCPNVSEVVDFTNRSRK